MHRNKLKFYIFLIKYFLQKERTGIMKNYKTLYEIVIVVVLSLLMLTGCAEKKSVITSDSAQGKDISSAVTRGDTDKDKLARGDAASEQSVDLEKMAKKVSPVSDIHFDYDSSNIRTDARETLQINADYFKKNRVSSIVIEGHCDERGTDEYNMALGERRAQETKKYLINLGVKESLMNTVSFGEEHPLDTTSNEEAWAKNRRSHFIVNP
jgi:peptidoglycan-associated lipoprotein